MKASISTRKSSFFISGAPGAGKHLIGDVAVIRNRNDGRLSGSRTGGKHFISGEPLPAGVTGIVSRYQPAAN